MLNNKVILGIDPGTTVMGYGILSVNDSKLNVLALGVLKLSKYDNHYKRLEKIYTRIISLINEFGASEMSIEAPFFGENVQSMLKLGRAQGVCIAAAMTKNIPVYEYAPKKIKISITGNGNASKEQVASMLSKMVNFSKTESLLDATDALAAAICHHHNAKKINTNSDYKGWTDFIKKNPNRVKGI